MFVLQTSPLYHTYTEPTQIKICGNKDIRLSKFVGYIAKTVVLDAGFGPALKSGGKIGPAKAELGGGMYLDFRYEDGEWKFGTKSRDSLRF